MSVAVAAPFHLGLAHTFFVRCKNHKCLWCLCEEGLSTWPTVCATWVSNHLFVRGSFLGTSAPWYQWRSSIGPLRRVWTDDGSEIYPYISLVSVARISFWQIQFNSKPDPLISRSQWLRLQIRNRGHEPNPTDGPSLEENGASRFACMLMLKPSSEKRLMWLFGVSNVTAAHSGSIRNDRNVTH